MSDRTFPTLAPALGMQLEAIRMQMEFDPIYLADPACPYSEQLKTILRRLVGPSQTGRDDTVNAVFQPDQDDNGQVDSLIMEIQSAINSMKKLAGEMDAAGVDTGDKLTFFKNYGSMMERFLSLKEKAHGSKAMYAFQRIVITTMEQVLDKDQRLDFKNLLKDAAISVPE